MRKSLTTHSSERSGVTVPLEIPQDVIDAYDGDLDKVRKTGIDAARNLANGGILIPPPLASRLEAVGLTDPQRIVEMAERGLGKRRDASYVEVRIDRAIMPSLEQVAKLAGVSVDRLVSDAISYGLSQGWVYHLRKEWITLRATPEDIRRIAEAMGVKDSEVDGKAIAEFLSHARV